MARDACRTCGCCNHCGARHETDEQPLEECVLDPDVPKERIEEILRAAGCNTDTTMGSLNAMLDVLQEREQLKEALRASRAVTAHKDLQGFEALARAHGMEYSAEFQQLALRAQELAKAVLTCSGCGVIHLENEGCGSGG